MPEETRQQSADETIRALARNEAKVETLTESMRELKRAVEELIDRVDADIDTLRAKAEGIAVTAAAVTDLQRRATVLETKVETLGLENAKLEAKLEAALIDRTKLETRCVSLEMKIETLSTRVYWMSGAAAALAWIAGKLFR